MPSGPGPEGSLLHKAHGWPACFRKLPDAERKSYALCRWKFLAKSQEQVLTVFASLVSASLPGIQKPYSLSLGVQTLIYRQKHLIKKGKPELFLPALRKQEKGGRALPKISREVGPHVTLFFREGSMGLMERNQRQPACLSLSLSLPCHLPGGSLHLRGNRDAWGRQGSQKRLMEWSSHGGPSQEGCEVT